jgi:flagellar motor protein MotB
VGELSANGANSMKEAILKDFLTLQPNHFTVSGLIWGRPADPGDPMNQAKNRRVKVKVYPLEAPK